MLLCGRIQKKQAIMLLNPNHNMHIMEEQYQKQAPQSNSHHFHTHQHLQHHSQQTIGQLIDSIEFDKKSKGRIKSETDSISSLKSNQVKEKAKIWSQEQKQLFKLLNDKFGTDFHILSSFFPGKTKSQLKTYYKQMLKAKKKEEKEEVSKLGALTLLFKEEKPQN